MRNKTQHDLSQAQFIKDDTYNQAIIALSKGEKAQSKNIYLTDMPLPFQAIGIKQDGFIISSKTLRKVMHRKHQLKVDALLKIPEQLADPVAIIRPEKNASNPNGLIVLSNLSEQENGKEKPIIITLSFQDKHEQELKITSIYGRRLSQIQQSLAGDILYWNTEKGFEFVNTFGLQLPTQLCSLQSLYESNIKTQHDLSQAQFAKDSAYLKERLGESARFITLTTTLPDGKPLIGEGVHLRGGHEHGQTYINPERIKALYNKDGEEILNRQERLLWVAHHELFHRGFSVLGKEELENTLKQASEHPLVSEIAELIKNQRKASDLPTLSQYEAIEEALAELYSAREMNSIQGVIDNYDAHHLKEKLENLFEQANFNLTLDQHQQNLNNTASALIQRDIRFDDHALSQLLNKIGDLGKTTTEPSLDFNWTKEPSKTYFSNNNKNTEPIDARETFRQEMLKELVEAIRENNAPWQRKWQAGELKMPYNGYSNNIYQGGNALRLALIAHKKGYSDARWLTFNQIKELGGSVRKGEKATGILHFSKIEVENKKTGEIEEKPFFKWHSVFNLDQTNLKEQRKDLDLNPIEPQPKLETFKKIIEHHNPTIITGRPAYTPSNDTISMPNKSQFIDEVSYYGTLLHEMAHWTGHKSRLNRDQTGRFGDEKYAHEEIIAELSKYLTCLEYSLPFEPTNAQAYMKGWANKSNEDLEKTLQKAFYEARKASNYLAEPLKEQHQNIYQDELKQNPLAKEKSERIYLNVPREEKDEAKALGAKWHRKEQKWYIQSTQNIDDFNKWLPKTQNKPEAPYISKIDQSENISQELTQQAGIEEAKIIKQNLEQGTQYEQTTTTTQKRSGDEQNLDEIFNQQLRDVITHKLGQDHIFQLGKPSEILINTGFPNLPIELRASKLWEKSRAERHPFDIGAVKNLPSAIQNPIAVFTYGDKNKSQNIITEIEYNGKKFLVGVHFNQLQDNIEFNSIRGFFPKDTHEWLNWIEQGKALYLDKEKVQTLISQQQMNPADVTYLDLNSVERIVQNFENVKHQEKYSIKENHPSLSKNAEQSLTDYFYQVFYQSHDENQLTQELLSKTPTYIAVAYEDRQEAKALGAKWDLEKKSWYIPVGADEAPFNKFSPQIEHSSHGKSLEDFKMAAENIGLDMRDFRENIGEWHRTRIKNKQTINKDGAYKLFHNADGSIGGIARNLSTGERINWINKNQTTNKIPHEQQHALELNQDTYFNCQAQARARITKQRAEDAQKLYQNLPSATGQEPYIQNKQIKEYQNIKALGSHIVLPLIDLNTNEIKSLQLIKADGSKQLMKQGQKTGAAIVIGDTNNLKKAENIILAEGFATADSALQIAKANGLQNTIAIAAVDAGNLLEVAKKINKINPQAQTLITADNDLATFYKHNKNPGLDAARAVQATFPHMKIIYPLSINNQNTDWNDALLKNGMNKSIREFQNTLKLNHPKNIQQLTQTVQQTTQQPTLEIQKNQKTQKNEQQERPKSKKEHSK